MSQPKNGDWAEEEGYEEFEEICEELEKKLAEKELYIEQLENKLKSVQDYINYMQKTNL